MEAELESDHNIVEIKEDHSVEIQESPYDIKKWRTQRRKYRKLWEQQFPWLREGVNGRPFCTLCACSLQMKKHAIMMHSRAAKHMQREGDKEMFKREPIKITLKEHTIADDLTDIHMAETPKHYPQKFRDGWLADSRLKSWLVKLEEDKAECSICNVRLKAKLSCLLKHAATEKHKDAASMTRDMPTIEASDMDNNALGFVAEYILQSPSQKVIHHAGDGLPSPVISGMEEVVMPANVGFIGCGDMAQVLMNSFLRNGLVDSRSVIVSAPSNKNLNKAQLFGIKTTTDNNKVINESDVVFLCVKPHSLTELLSSLECVQGSRSPLFISIVSGVTIGWLENMLNLAVNSPKVIRAVLNSPCMVSQGTCVYAVGQHVSSLDGTIVKCLLSSLGLCEEVPEEQISVVCGLSTAGPAYIYAAVEALADGGVKMGLPRSLSQSLAAHMIKGAASMVLDSGKHPAVLKDEICTPGGPTIAAMHSLEKHGYRNALISAVEAATLRSQEIEAKL